LIIGSKIFVSTVVPTYPPIILLLEIEVLAIYIVMSVPQTVTSNTNSIVVSKVKASTGVGVPGT